jgi:hypothetical protein
VYRLVRIQGSTSAAGKTASPQWKIEEPARVLWLNRETAIRYVAEMRDRTRDPLIKKNADRSLAALRRQHH